MVFFKIKICSLVFPISTETTYKEKQQNEIGGNIFYRKRKKNKEKIKTPNERGDFNGQQCWHPRTSFNHILSGDHQGKKNKNIFIAYVLLALS